ncbi:hypothetical protein M9H77_04917 [Catharanthus roseus]|uniref:Uncharacterized protein n=1 Tax=Catharanthus roseus TaxID=4058 RepID=A0ACC0CFF8_CATRO|nr:hypothetical protein M9H77_04917 [Catharanthus roseus]
MIGYPTLLYLPTPPSIRIQTNNITNRRALTPCAILDVLGLPYSDSQGRHCAYYQDYSFSTFSVRIELFVIDDDSGASELPAGEDRNQYVWLEEIEQPEHFAVVGATH